MRSNIFCAIVKKLNLVVEFRWLIISMWLSLVVELRVAHHLGVVEPVETTSAGLSDVGFVPVIRLKKLLKYVGYSNPKAYPMSATFQSV
jgi:hypothetical protein